MTYPVIQLDPKFFNGVTVGDLLVALQALAPDTVINLQREDDDPVQFFASQAYVTMLIGDEEHEGLHPDGIWTVRDQFGSVWGRFAQWKDLCQRFSNVTVIDDGVDVTTILRSAA